MPYSNANGLRIYYEVSGEGFPFVMVHANPFDHNLWMYQIAHFSTYFKVVAIDIRGYGRSDKPSAPFTLKDMDSPLRSSFVMGVVRPEDRGSAAGITTLSRQVPVAVSPTISAYLMHSFSLNVPIFLGGFLQLINDFSFYFLFRDVKPPEEQTAKPQPVMTHEGILRSASGMERRSCSTIFQRLQRKCQSGCAGDE